MTLLMAQIFDFHRIISAVMTQTPTKSLVKTSL